MAVASSSFQPSRMGFGSIVGAPRPAGRIEKSRCAALPSSGTPTRPSTVPPSTRAPTFSVRRRKRLGSSGRESLPEKSSKPGCLPVTAIWSSPPASRASGCDGLANRRSFTGSDACGAGTSSRGEGWRPAEAARDGRGSARRATARSFGSMSPLGTG